MKPPISNDVVTPALREAFEAGWQTCRVIFFSAPCGFGKTTTADVLLAGQTVCRRSAAQPDDLSAPLDATCNAVLIDEVHLLKNPVDQQTVCGWINANPNVHFVLLSRGALPGWLMPYQFTGLLLGIEAQQLMFDRATTGRLLSQNGVEPTAGELTAIQNDSSGYPLAISILSRRMAGGMPYQVSVADEVRREMFFYFEEAVYRRFDPSLRQLLVRLACFEHFDAELAKLISGDSHVNDLLAQILHDTTMLQFDGVETYHFWPVFRQFLLWEMKQDCTVEEQNDIYRRAGFSYELQDDYSHALDCYSKGGDHRKVCDLLIKNAQLHPGVAHYHEMERYYYAMPREDVLRSPVLMCGMSMLTAMCLDFEASEQWYAELQNYVARLQKSDANYKEAKSRLIYLDIALPQRGSKGLIELIGTVFRAVTDKNLRLPAFSVTSTLPSVMNGGKDFCEWSKMDDLLYATMRLPVETVLGKDGIGLADCAICESKLEKGEDISTRLLALMARINEIQRKGTPDIFFATMGLMIRVQVMQGKAHTALSTLEEVRQNFVETGQARFLANVDAMRCRIWLRLGMQEEIDRWLRETAPSITSHFRAMWRYQYMTKAMVQIACGTPNEALLSIAPLLPYCERCARIMDSLHLRVLVAICHYRQKDDHWKPELLPALDAAADYGFITPVAQYGAAILPLLTTCGWNKDPAFYQRLLAATREQTVYYPDFLRPAIALAEPLTPAEKQVLRLLCHNRSNQEIADILGVKLPTIKSQVRSILQKLDVKRRSEAKEAAETLNLL